MSRHLASITVVCVVVASIQLGVAITAGAGWALALAAVCSATAIGFGVARQARSMIEDAAPARLVKAWTGRTGHIADTKPAHG